MRADKLTAGSDLSIRPSAESKIGSVPEISRFLGIVIGMFYKDHNPPHFHASYGDHEAAIAIHDGAILWGTLPKRALAHVLEWREGHVAALEEDWERARQHQPLKPIEPLE